MTIAKTESPIESLLLGAFTLVARDVERVVLTKSEAPNIARHAYAKPGTVFVAPQVKVGPYRADFLVAGVFGKHGTRPTVLCVECDGHAFHKGADNRARDSTRDLWFRKKGINTVRFPGFKLWKDPYACAYEVMAGLGIPGRPPIPEKLYWSISMQDADTEWHRSRLPIDDEDYADGEIE